MAEEETAAATEPRARRRASRAAGPAGEAVTVSGATASASAPASEPSTATKRSTRPVGPPPRRAAHAGRVAAVAASVLLGAIIVLGALVAVLGIQQRHADTVAARDRQFVDTAAQSVVNMFSYSQDNVDESVERFVAGTSGPLRDTMGNNVENLKALFRAANTSSEAVINGAALEGTDDEAGNASVLVATRVTVTDAEGINKPSQPFRLRVIVHEDDSGNMTAYDLKYPDGGN